MGIATKWGTGVSGDATATTNKALTIADNSVDGTDIALGSDAAGDVMYYNGTDWVRLAKGTAHQVLELNAGNTAPAWATKGVIYCQVTDILAAAVKTLNATPVAVADHSALITAGVCASGDALIFHGALWNIYGGSTDYDQDCDMTIQYTTGPVVVSLTDDDGLNDGTAGSIGTLKPLATDLAYNQVLIDNDLELATTASPYNAAGDRNLRIACYYSVFTPHA